MALDDEFEQQNGWCPRVVPSGADGHLPPPRELAHGAVGRLSRDELVQQDICAALLASHELDAHQVEVEMTAEGVVLRGTVATENDRSRALEIATKIAGRRIVRDALIVSRNDRAGRHPRGAPSANGQRHDE